MSKIMISSGSKKLIDYLRERGEFLKFIRNGELDPLLSEILESKRFCKIERGSLNNSGTERFCHSYIDLIGRIGLHYNSIYWWVTFVASKNRFTSKMANRLFFIDSALETIRENMNQDLLIVNSDKPSCLAMFKFLRHKNSDVVFIEESSASSLLLEAANSIKTLCSACVFILRTWGKICIVKKHIKKLLKKPLISPSYHVIKTFIYNSSFDSNCKYKDAFFGILPEYISKNKDIIVLGDILGEYGRVIRMSSKNGAYHILPIESFISFLDPIKAVFRTWLNKLRIGQNINYSGIDIANIINFEIDEDFKRGSPFRQYLHYLCIGKLVRRVNIDVFTYTYENNPWERMSILALREHSPSTKIIGYQHTVVPLASANMFLSKLEKDVVPYPDKILTVGAVPKKIMEQRSSLKDLKLEESCALRFKYLFNAIGTQRMKTNRILLALDGPFEVYKLVNYAMRELYNAHNFKVKVRPHPTLPLSAFKHKLDYPIKDLAHFFISKTDNVSVKEDIVWADIVIYWGSTLALEALMMGKPVIHFNTQDVLSYDPLFEMSHLKWTVTENDRLEDVLKEIYNTDEARFNLQLKRSQEYLNDYFHKVTDECLVKFIT